MPRRNPIGRSFLFAWLTAWLALTLLIGAASLLDSGSAITELVAFLVFISIYISIGTFVVVGATWLVVAIPYYFCCMTRHDLPFFHHAAGAVLAITITGIMTGGDSGAWPFLAIVALLTSFVGIQCMLNCLKSEPDKNETPDHDPIAPIP